MSRTQLVLLSSLKLVKAQAEPLLPTWDLHPALEVTLCPHTWAICGGTNARISRHHVKLAHAVLQKHTETTARQNGQRERPGRVRKGEGMRS